MVENEREPGWFPLIARAASPQALLSFRYIDAINSGLDSPRDDWELKETKLWPGGPGQPCSASRLLGGRT
jgi:hypothetical protein